jgi:hypothetical protein
MLHLVPPAWPVGCYCPVGWHALVHSVAACYPAPFLLMSDVCRALGIRLRLVGWVGSLAGMLLLVRSLLSIRHALPTSVACLLLAVLVWSAGMPLRVLSSPIVGSHLLCGVCRLPCASRQPYLRTYLFGWTYNLHRVRDIHIYFCFFEFHRCHPTYVVCFKAKGCIV